MDKVKLAIYCAAGCGGCDIAVLETHEALLPMLERLEIVFWPTVVDFSYADVAAMADGSIDICLISGAIRTEENAEVVRLLRRKSAALVAFGACASIGGVPGLANLGSVEGLLRRVYVDGESTENAEGVLPASTRFAGHDVPLTPLADRVTPLRAVTAVNYVVPGCPPESARVADVLSAVVSGRVPEAPAVLGAGNKAVCDECDLLRREVRPERYVRHHLAPPDGDGCLLERGMTCAGPATRSGCRARCPHAGVPCRGCYGATAATADAGAKMASLVGGLIDSEDEARLVAEAGSLVDPVGTFYRFGLADSILERANDAVAMPDAEADDEEPAAAAHLDEDGGQAA